jgi:hypothetical protein
MSVTSAYLKKIGIKPLLNEMQIRILLLCGILSSLLYVAMLIFVPMQYEGYNSFTQTISELSAHK